MSFDCHKADNAAKDYYISEVVSWIRERFSAGRNECSLQSIDEYMAKFKGHSS